MRILLTGMTRAQTGVTGRQRVRYADVTTPLVKALTLAGHEVDRRPVGVGENLKDRYDAALVGVSAPNGFGSRYLYGCLWALNELERHKIPYRLLVDDWAVRNVSSSLRSCARVPDRCLAPELKSFLQRDDANLVPGVRTLLELTLQDLARRPWFDVICPMWGWGDRALFTRGTCVDTVQGYDPSPLLDIPGEHGTVDDTPHTREKAWVLAGLTDQSAWVEECRRAGMGWELREFGRPKQGQSLIEEADLVDLYGHVWGVMCPPYAHSGSGWWRNRLWFAACRGAIFCAGRDEVRILGWPPVTPRNLKQLEDSSPSSWAAVADLQRRLVLQHAWSTDHLVGHAAALARQLEISRGLALA